MIDIENELITKLSSTLTAVEGLSDILVVSENLNYVAEHFPLVTVMEIDNTTHRGTLTQTGCENHAKLAYDINVYSRLPSGKKQQCKAILSVIDDFMTGYNFVRIYYGELAYVSDASVCRMVTRYEALVGRDKTLYRS